LVGVLARLKDSSLWQATKELVINISLEENGWGHQQLSNLKESIHLLGKYADKNGLLNLLCDLVTHPANQVRACLASLFNGLISVLNADDVSHRVVPSLITLSSDPDKLVRSACIQAFGTVVITLEDQNVMDKIQHQLVSFISDGTHLTKVEIAKTFTNIIPHVQAKYRDHFILPTLVDIVKKNSENTNTYQRGELAQFLFEAFRACNGCQIEEDITREYVLPGLKQLQYEAQFSDPTSKSMIVALITDMEGSKQAAPVESKVIPPTKSAAFLTKLNPLGLNLKKQWGYAPQNEK